MKQRIHCAALATTLCLALLPVQAAALTVTDRPQPGTTQGQPFEHDPDTAGSDSFRIPGLTTLRDGALLATADARWNTTYDGGGLDTIVSRSEDNGETWNYNFANYLGDNGNEYSGDGSTCFIDPSVAVKYEGSQETIYLLADLYPYGVALNGSGNLWPAKETGFDGQGRLLLSTDSYGNEVQGNNQTYTYDYYLDGDTIKSVSGDTPVEGLTVDEHFNVTGTYNGQPVDSNLFFQNAPFKVQRTSFLYLVTSTDGGKSWSAPTLLPLKKDSERAYLVAPSKGLVTSRGEIVFPCYSFDNTGSSQPQHISFLYSEDGVNWARSDDDPSSTADQWDSESVAVELSDGRLRFFARNNHTKRLSYFDFIPGTAGLADGHWENRVNTSVITNSNCQISVIEYSHTSQGKEVLLISCPASSNPNGDNQSGASYRNNGKIFVARVNRDADMTLEWVDSATIDIDPSRSDDPFMYSAITELTRDGNGAETGDIAILYEMNENGWGAGIGKYYEMTFETRSLSGIDFDPIFTKQPVNNGGPLTLGDKSLQLSVETDITANVTYQWYKKTDAGEMAINGAIEKTYTVDTDALGLGEHQLFCRAVNGRCTVDSNPVKVQVIPAPVTYTITLDAQGGSGTAASLTTNADGKLTSLPTPTRAGYAFNGWYTLPTSGDKITTDTVFQANATIYAQWTANSSGGGSSSGSTRYTVSVEGMDNGSVKVSPTRASKGSTVTVTVKPDEGYELDKLTVTDKNGDSVKLTDKGDGKYTFKMPASKVTVEAVFTAVEPEPEGLPFTDVTSGDWFYDAVAYVYDKGMMEGTTDTTFAPTMNLTRSMIAQVLYNLEERPEAPGAAGFPDVAAGAWYADAVNWAAARGIVKGYDTGAFGPEDSVTREQLAAILYRYAQAKGYDTTQGGMAVREFSDSASISDWAQTAMSWAVNAQVLSGKGNGVLDPQGTATRAEVAQMLMNFGEHVG
ncbi:MAG: S-layer homology domain-containing protein [Flavonifractor plautii]|nr:S-layer homology domain-containing protein [Flavonifractor plautii]